MTNTKTPPPSIEMESRPFDARVMTMKFPEDDDIPDRKVVVYFFRPTKH